MSLRNAHGSWQNGHSVLTEWTGFTFSSQIEVVLDGHSRCVHGLLRIIHGALTAFTPRIRLSRRVYNLFCSVSDFNVSLAQHLWFSCTTEHGEEPRQYKGAHLRFPSSCLHLSYREDMPFITYDDINMLLGAYGITLLAAADISAHRLENEERRREEALRAAAERRGRPGKRRQRPRRFWVRSWLQKRTLYEQYEKLMSELRLENPQSFNNFPDDGTICLRRTPASCWT